MNYKEIKLTKTFYELKIFIGFVTSNATNPLKCSKICMACLLLSCGKKQQLH